MATLRPLGGSPPDPPRPPAPRTPEPAAPPDRFTPGLAGLARRLAAPGPLEIPPVWTTEAEFVPLASPAGAGGFVGRPDGQVAGIDPEDGRERWRRPVGDLAGAPVATAAGNALAATRDGRVVCLSPEGENRWEARVADRLEEPPVPAPGGRLLVRTPGGALHALDEADGREAWRQQVGGGFERSPRPAVGPDGTAYVVTFSRTSPGHLHALSPRDGSPLWSTGLSATPASLATDPEGRLLVGYTVGRLSAFEGATGRFLWHADAGGLDRHASVRPAPGSEGAVFASTDQGQVYALAPDGTPLWRREVAPERLSAPVVGSGGDLLVADPTGRVHSLDAGAGTVRWRSEASLEERARQAPAPPWTAGETVVTADHHGRLRAASPLQSLAREAPPDPAGEIRAEAGQVTIGGISLPVRD